MNSYPILLVASGKGGVGKSTLSFQLSKLLTKNNFKIGLLDADLYGPSLHLLFKEDELGIPFESQGILTPEEPGGIKFMSSAYFAPGGAFIRAPKANAMIKSFFDQVNWSGIDLLIVDLPPGTGDIHMTLIQEVFIDAALIVTTPHSLSIEDAAKSMNQFKQGGIPILGVCENFSYIEIDGKKMFPFGQKGTEELSQIFDVPLLSQIPQILDIETQPEVFEKHLDSVASKCKKLILNKKGQNVCLK